MRSEASGGGVVCSFRARRRVGSKELGMLTQVVCRRQVIK